MLSYPIRFLPYLLLLVNLKLFTGKNRYFCNQSSVEISLLHISHMYIAVEAVQNHMIFVFSHWYWLFSLATAASVCVARIYKKWKVSFGT